MLLTSHLILEEEMPARKTMENSGRHLWLRNRYWINSSSSSSSYHIIWLTPDCIYKILDFAYYYYYCKMSKDTLVFEKIAPFPNINFWQEFSHLKLDKLRLDDKPLGIYGTYTVQSKSLKGSILSISEAGLPGAEISSHGGIIEVKVAGSLQNTNTLEQFLQANRNEIAGIS